MEVAALYLVIRLSEIFPSSDTLANASIFKSIILTEEPSPFKGINNAVLLQTDSQIYIQDFHLKFNNGITI